MASLSEFFQHLLDRRASYLNAETGSAFENRFTSELGKRVGLSRVVKDQIGSDEFAIVKRAAQEKVAEEAIENPTEFRQDFIVQPYGSQAYPDIIIFDGDWLHPIEMKFSTKNQGHPMWNSGAPRPNGIYVFGAYERQDLTFFLGRSVLEPRLAAIMHEKWEEVQAEIESFNAEVASAQEYGFHIYPRKAFDQKKKLNRRAVTDFFTNPKRERLEAEVIAYLRGFE